MIGNVATLPDATVAVVVGELNVTVPAVMVNGIRFRAAFPCVSVAVTINPGSGPMIPAEVVVASVNVWSPAVTSPCVPSS